MGYDILVEMDWGTSDNYKISSVSAGLDDDFEEIAGRPLRGVMDSDEWHVLDIELDMAEISKLYPNVTFFLTGEGQDWYMWIKAGKVVKTNDKIIFDKIIISVDGDLSTP